MTRPATARALLAAFGTVTAVHLTAHAVGVEPLQQFTKPLLMPLLAGWAFLRGAPRLLLVALAFGWGGDVLLQTGAEPLFLLGMASFGAGHVCYLRLFLRAPDRSSRRLAVLAAPYALACAVVVALLWGGLDPDLRVPVAGYSLLLTAMACVAAAAGLPRAGLGGALFLLSDTLIAGGLADWPQPAAPGLWIMLTYVAAQYLLTDGALRGYPASHSATSRLGATAR